MKTLIAFWKQFQTYRNYGRIFNVMLTNSVVVQDPNLKFRRCMIMRFADGAVPSTKLEWCIRQLNILGLLTEPIRSSKSTYNLERDAVYYPMLQELSEIFTESTDMCDYKGRAWFADRLNRFVKSRQA